MHIIRFGVFPEHRERFPLGVATWLMPTALAMDRIAAERRAK